MTTLKEKILEILHKQDYHTTALVIKQIVSLFEGYYEKEFVEWIGELDIKYHSDRFKLWIIHDDFKNRMSTDELYAYWQNEIKDK